MGSSTVSEVGDTVCSLAAEPPASTTTTVTGPLVAATGTTAVSAVLPLRLAMAATPPPPKRNSVARSSPRPLTVSVCPRAMVAGVKPVTASAASTVTGCATLRAVPARSTSASVPEAALNGTSSARLEALWLAMASATAPRRALPTWSSALPASVRRPLPAMTVVGDTEVTVGTAGAGAGAGAAATVKSLVETAVRPPALTPTRPLVAPVGTVTLSSVAETLTKLAAVLPTVTAVTASSPVPLTATTVPAGPLAGVKPVMARAGCVAGGLGWPGLAAEGGVPSLAPPQASSARVEAAAAQRASRRSASAVDAMRAVDEPSGSGI